MQSYLRSIPGLTLLCIFVSGSIADGQEPQLTSLFPAGGQRGSEVEVTLAGSFPTWPVKFWCDQADCVWTATETSGKSKVAIAADAPPGVRWLRIYDAKGASALRPFAIGLAAEVNEAPADGKTATPQAIALLPTVINGVLDKSGNADTYSVKLSKGQQLVASLDANRGPRSPVDATLQILNSVGIVLEQNLDFHGLDPQIVFQPPQDGEFQVRIFGFPEAPDSTIAYSGNPSHIYRLTLTTGPYLEGSIPLALSKTKPNELTSIGFNLGALTRISAAPRPNDTETAAVFEVGAVGSLGLPFKTCEVVAEQATADTKTKQVIVVPCCLTGRIQAAKEMDEYVFDCKAGTRWKVQLESRSLGYPMDGVITLRDGQGKQLVMQDDNGPAPDPTLEWQCPADGNFSVSVSDLYGQGSDLHLYRLSIEEDTPRAELSVPNDVFKGTVGQPVEIQVNITRKFDYADELSFQIEGGPTGITLTPVQSVVGNDSAKSVKLILQSTEPFQGPIKILAQPKMQPETKITTFASNQNQTSLWLSIVAP